MIHIDIITKNTQFIIQFSSIQGLITQVGHVPMFWVLLTHSFGQVQNCATMDFSCKSITPNMSCKISKEK